jgi:hypothetical protein
MRKAPSMAAATGIFVSTLCIIQTIVQIITATRMVLSPDLKAAPGPKETGEKCKKAQGTAVHPDKARPARICENKNHSMFQISFISRREDMVRRMPRLLDF